MQLRKYCPYDVGDYYITESAVNPSEKWAGTSWERIQDCMLMAAGATYTAGTSGGSATHAHTTGNCTLTVDQIPSHTHSVGAHAHGLNSHTHGLNNHTHSYNAANGTGSTAVTEAQLAKVTGTISLRDAASGNIRLAYSTSGKFSSAADGSDRSPMQLAGSAAASGTKVTYAFGSGSGHTHTTNTTSTNTGAASGSTAAASGNTANSTAFDSGTAGGGKAHSHGDTGSASSLPPYLAVYMWKRVA